MPFPLKDKVIRTIRVYTIGDLIAKRCKKRRVNNLSNSNNFIIFVDEIFTKDLKYQGVAIRYNPTK